MKEREEFIQNRNALEANWIDPNIVIRVSETNTQQELDALIEEVGYYVDMESPWGDDDIDFSSIEILGVLPEPDYSLWIEDRREVARKLIEDGVTDESVWKEELGGWKIKYEYGKQQGSKKNN